MSQAIFASEITPEIAVALAAGGDLGVRELARIAGRSPSSIQRALSSLVEGAVVDRTKNSQYRLVGRVGEIVDDLAFETLPPVRSLEITSLASPAVEFASVDEQGAVVVTRWDADLADLARLESAVERLRGRSSSAMDVTVLDGDDVRDQMPEGQSLRRRVLRSRVVKGTLARSFPDLEQHGDPSAPALGGLNPSVPTPPAGRLRSIASRFGLDRIVVFGSAVRTDLRPDSDIDVLIEPEEGRVIGLDGYVGVRTALEDIFGRRVDLVTPDTLRPGVLSNARTEGVAIYERARSRGA